MWPFTKTYPVAESGILRDFTDWHCHLLPGVDDGVQTLDETLRILASYEQQGIREVWLTPHVMEDIPNSSDFLRAVFADLQEAYHGPVQLHLAAEYMLDNLFEECLQADDLLPIGMEGRHLLVETSYFNPPYGLRNILQRIKSKGYIPLLAHPERYLYMDKEEYGQLRETQVALQLNLPSLYGAYGSGAKRKARWLLQKGYYSFVGTDTHTLFAWQTTLARRGPWTHLP